MVAQGRLLDECPYHERRVIYIRRIDYTFQKNITLRTYESVASTTMYTPTAMAGHLDKRVSRLTCSISALLVAAKRARRGAPYMCVGALTPMSVSAVATTMRTASQAHRRAPESSAATGRPSLGSTWQRV